MYTFLVSPKLLIPFSLSSNGYITSIAPYITDGCMLLSNVAVNCLVLNYVKDRV